MAMLKEIHKYVTIVTPAREIDSLAQIEIHEVQRIYPHIRLIIIVDKLPSVDIPFADIVLSESKLLSEKRNQGVKLVKTEYTAFLDSDAYPHEGWLECAMGFKTKNPGVGMVGGPNLEYKKLGLDQSVPIAAYRSVLLNVEPNLKDKEYKNVKYVISSNMMVRTKEYILMGGMSSKIKTGEDIVLCERYLKKGLGIVFLRNMKVSHKQRYFIGFLKQRFVWGRSVWNVLKEVFPSYLISLLPFLGLLTSMLLLLIDQCYETSLFVWAHMFYLLIVLFEGIRVASNPYQFISIIPYLFSSPYAIGFGTLWALIFGDIKNYKHYENKI